MTLTEKEINNTMTLTEEEINKIDILFAKFEAEAECYY